VKGVGESAAALLKLTPQVYRRSRMAAAERERVLNSSQRAGDYLLELFTGETAEVLYELCLDRKGKLLACRRVGEGGVSSINVDLRKIVENALLTGASGVILSLPSADDCAATVRVREALKTVGLVLVDHIVVADGDYVSMADSGQLR
jgi:DNA repair protein RadC